MVPVKTNQNWLPSIFNDFFDNEWMSRANATAPAINVIENEKDYKVELAAPGMTKNDFKVSVDESNNLVICMEKKDEKKEEKKDGKYLRREFSYSRFQQSILLPDNVEKDKISAKVEHGVLFIDIPKVVDKKVQETTKTITRVVIGFCKVIPYTIAWASSLTINFTSFKIAFFSVAFTTESLYAVVYL